MFTRDKEKNKKLLIFNWTIKPFLFIFYILIYNI